MFELKQDQYWMQQAIELAKRGLYSTKPNPNVGCVIVKDDQLIGQGFHPKAGQPHAEVLPYAKRVNMHKVQRLMSRLNHVHIMAEPLLVPKHW